MYVDTEINCNHNTNTNTLHQDEFHFLAFVWSIKD